MDPWSAPYQNSNDYWCLTYDQRSGTNFLQTSVNFTISTQCYTKGHYKEGNLHTNLRCCFHHPAMPHPLFGGESVSSMVCLHTCEQTVTNVHITTYFNTHHQDWVCSLSFHSLQHQWQILQQWHKTTMNITTQISHQCAVTHPLNVLSTSTHSKQRKIQQTLRCVPRNTAIC
jgi:hypothetical protein